MDDRSILAELKRDYGWLFDELGLEVIEEHFTERAFGNSFATLRGKRGLVQIVRDRGLRTVETSARIRSPEWKFLGGDALVLAGDPPQEFVSFDEAMKKVRAEFQP